MVRRVFRVAILCASSCSCGALGSAQTCVTNELSFARTDHAIGATPRDLIVGDWNNDGVLDLLSTTSGDQTLTVLLGSGAGSFAPAYALATSFAAFDVASADADADGALDLALAYPAESRVEIRRGDGTGGFAIASVIATDGRPGELAFAHFGADAVIDLAIGLPHAHAVDVYRGGGGGSFTLVSSTSTSIAPALLRVGDLDADGRADLVASNDHFVGAEWAVLSLLGNGSGGFGASVSTSCSGAPVDIELADIDADGVLDLFAPTDDGLGALTEARIGDGAGGFPGIKAFVSDSADVHAVDVDANGLPECVSTHWSALLQWTMGAGDGEFSPFSHSVSIESASNAQASGDFDGDGDRDIASANLAASVSVLLASVAPIPSSLGAPSPASVPSVAAPLPSSKIVTCAGSGFECVQQVAVDGVTLAQSFANGWYALSPTQLRIVVPLVPHQGQVALEVTLNGTTLSVPLVIAPNDPPVLQFASSPQLSVAQGAQLRVGAAAGDYAFLLWSPSGAPTQIPGLVSLNLGNGGSELYQLESFALGAAGWSQRTYPGPLGVHVGLQLYFQAVLIDPLAPQFPLAATNGVDATVKP